MILLHGRGAGAQSILLLANEFRRPQMAYVAPQAANSTWYPTRFIAPLAANEPWLTWALARVGDVLDQVAQAGIPPARTFLGGFSQGACLALEFAARNPQRYAGIIGLSGGLIGPPGIEWQYTGSLDATPVLLGCSDVDFHIPLARVHESATVLTALGAQVDTRIYPGMEHTVNQDEIDAIMAMIDRSS
jgi:predicted esterase